ncbi:unnamed protein product [Cuscuta epithymum]|uniref:Uncharacterized protein n=1 Tax=Cuscuta epithymum TaxID=186058 RepID=A0AAV0FMT3_9ASTE|nr:unnamed protein product [Cuscuta epithymum]
MEGRRMRTRNNPRGQAPVTSQRGSRAASRGSRGGRGGRGSRGGHQAQTVEARACYLHLSTGDINQGRRAGTELVVHFATITSNSLMTMSTKLKMNPSFSLCNCAGRSATKETFQCLHHST